MSSNFVSQIFKAIFFSETGKSASLVGESERGAPVWSEVARLLASVLSLSLWLPRGGGGGAEDGLAGGRTGAGGGSSLPPLNKTDISAWCIRGIVFCFDTSYNYSMMPFKTIFIVIACKLQFIVLSSRDEKK
jgi:hypothetical protein